jgi:hypothetical protein
MPPLESQQQPDPNFSHQSQRVTEANLDFFVADRIMPLIERIEGKPKSSFVNAELLEAFLWLHHGVVITYFPLAQARRVAYEFFPFFLKAYETLLRKSYYQTWFPPPIRATFESQFTGNYELFSFGRRESQPRGVEAVFQQLLILADDLLLNPTARLLMHAVNEKPDEEWRKVSNAVAARNFNPPISWVVTDETEGRIGEPEHWMYPGFFGLLEYLRAYRNVNVDLSERQPEGQNYFDFLQTLKEIQQWRLNFGYLEYRERFMLSARIAAETYSKEFSDASWAVADFLQSFYDLATDWGAPLTRVAGA